MTEELPIAVPYGRSAVRRRFLLVGAGGAVAVVLVGLLGIASGLEGDMLVAARVAMLTPPVVYAIWWILSPGVTAVVAVEPPTEVDIPVIAPGEGAAAADAFQLGRSDELLATRQAYLASIREQDAAVPHTMPAPFRRRA